MVLMKRNARMDLQLDREVRKAVDFVRAGRAEYRCVHHPTHFLVRASMLSDPELAKIKYDIFVRPAFDRGLPELGKDGVRFLATSVLVPPPTSYHIAPVTCVEPCRTYMGVGGGGGCWV